MKLSPLDWSVIAVYFLFNLGIGIYYARRARGSTSEFFLSGRNVPWWLAGTSMVATTFAADTPLAVNPVDTYVRAGQHSLRPRLPYTPGVDGAGVIESIGEGVKRVKPGDRVYVAGTLNGTYAEKALCSEIQVHLLAEKISFEQGAAVNVPYATAYRALFQRAIAKPGEVVLVHGASGGVGIAAVQLARAAGLTIPTPKPTLTRPLWLERQMNG